MALPTKREVKRVLRCAFGRHTGGVRAWWKQNAAKMGPNFIAEVLLTIYEAGRNGR